MSCFGFLLNLAAQIFLVCLRKELEVCLGTEELLSCTPDGFYALLLVVLSPVQIPRSNSRQLPFLELERHVRTSVSTPTFLPQRVIGNSERCCKTPLALRKSFCFNFVKYHFGHFHSNIPNASTEIIYFHLVPSFWSMISDHPIHALGGWNNENNS